ncbi:unnamed protein product [Phytophthora fragariaefolia]|uniref:Unnamed protein product n=1 Tax=Phytophthora fragariaefolia TaxID=1490495 RepID=A0A9W7D448_9STRA|nr:unnamed protein product [Phytophthora fragariaefolia]
MTEWSASRVDGCASMTMTMMRVTTAEIPTPTRKEGQTMTIFTLDSQMKRVVGRMFARTRLGLKRTRLELSGSQLDIIGARLSSGIRLISQPIPLAEQIGSLIAESAESVAEAKYIFAYVGEAGRPERERTDGNGGSKMDGIDGEFDYSKEDSRPLTSNVGATRLGKGAEGMAKTMKLLPGERLGWWSAQKVDRRVRMRALVMGAVNDQRTKILLDTGANISTFARKLRLKRQASQDVQIGVQGIGKDKVGTSITR